MRFFYNIAGIGVKGETPYELTLQEESVPFLLKNFDKNDCDIDVTFTRLPNMCVPEEKGIWKANRLYCRQDGSDIVYYYPNRNDLPYARVLRGKGSLCIEYTDTSIPYINYSHNLIDLISLESLLLDYHGMIVHSSFIRWRDKGLIFSAPSGTGKSTQASLWMKYEQVECLNGDRAGLRKVKGNWIAYGLPYAGSSGIYRNEAVPLGAIIVLKQSKENNLSRMKPSDAFRAIYPETLIHQWDAAFVNTAADYITELVTDIPVYLLSCRPDREAVSVLRDELVKEGIVE